MCGNFTCVCVCVCMCVRVQQLNLRLEAIKTHCDHMGCGAEVGPSMDVFEHAEKITQSSNSVLESSGK